MNRVTLIVFLSFFFQLNINAGTDPKPSDIALAKKLKAELPDSEIIAINSTRMVDFDFDTKANQLIATESIREDLICTATNANHTVYDFYNNQTEITDVIVRNNKGKKKNVAVKREYYSQEGIFYSDAKVCYFGLNFPAQGQRYKVQIDKQYNDVKYFTSIYLARPYLIKEEAIVFTVPRWLKLKLVDKNFEGYDIKVDRKYDEEKDVDIIKYTLKDVKPMVQEDHAPGPSHLYPHILLVAQSYQQNDKEVTLFNTTDDLYKWYKSLVNQMDNDETVIKKMAEEISKDATTDLEKIKSIYYWVQNNIRYIAFEDGIAGFKPDEAQNVLEKKYGDCKGMANLTKMLLNVLGYDARLTWIGTRRLAYDYSLPSLSVDNHMICTVFYNGEKYFLDATEGFNQLGDYAERIQGRPVMIENGKTFELTEIPETDYEKNTLHLKKQLKIEGDNLVGNGNYQYNGESKANFIYQLNHVESTKLETVLTEYISDGEKNYKISNIKHSDIEQRDQPLDINYDLNWENIVSSFGDEIYIELDFYKEFKKFKLEEDRLNDYVFSYKINQLTEIELEIPAAYKLAYIPEGLVMDFDNFTFLVSYKEQDGKLIYSKQISVKNAIIKKEDFELWNKCIDGLAKSYGEQLLLKRKT